MPPFSFSFSFADPNRKYSTLCVAGTFNGWDPMGTPLSFQEGSGKWTRDVTMETPMFFYKYVADGSNWILDTSAPSEYDEGGMINNCGEATAVDGKTTSGETTPLLPKNEDTDHPTTPPKRSSPPPVISKESPAAALSPLLDEATTTTAVATYSTVSKLKIPSQSQPLPEPQPQAVDIDEQDSQLPNPFATFFYGLLACIRWLFQCVCSRR